MWQKHCHHDIKAMNLTGIKDKFSYLVSVFLCTSEVFASLIVLISVWYIKCGSLITQSACSSRPSFFFFTSLLCYCLCHHCVVISHCRTHVRFLLQKKSTCFKVSGGLWSFWSETKRITITVTPLLLHNTNADNWLSHSTSQFIPESEIISEWVNEW